MVESIGSTPEEFIRGAANWSRGPDIRVLTEDGVKRWHAHPSWREAQEIWARQNTAKEKVPTEIRALDAEGELLYSTTKEPAPR